MSSLYHLVWAYSSRLLSSGSWPFYLSELPPTALTLKDPEFIPEVLHSTYSRYWLTAALPCLQIPVMESGNHGNIITFILTCKHGLCFYMESWKHSLYFYMKSWKYSLYSYSTWKHSPLWNIACALCGDFGLASCMTNIFLGNPPKGVCYSNESERLSRPYMLRQVSEYSARASRGEQSISRRTTTERQEDSEQASVFCLLFSPASLPSALTHLV